MGIKEVMKQNNLEPLGTLSKQQIRSYKKLQRLNEEYKKHERIWNTAAQKLYVAREEVVAQGRLFFASIIRTLGLEPTAVYVDPETYEVFSATLDKQSGSSKVKPATPEEEAVIARLREIVYESTTKAIEDVEENEDELEAELEDDREDTEDFSSSVLRSLLNRLPNTK